MKRSFLLVLAALCLIAQPALAHTTGASWNQTVGPYTVDVGYDPVTFTAGQYTRFDFLLWKGPANTGESVDYAQIWVRIIDSEHNTYLATGIWRQPIGPTTLLYDFLEPGTYTIETSYRDTDGNDIAVASFPITVSSADGNALATYGIGIGLFILGLLAGVFGGRRFWRPRAASVEGTGVQP